MSRALLLAALFVSLAGSASGELAARAAAQDALGGSQVDDEWDAILKLTPPAAAASSDAPAKKGRDERASTRAAREASGAGDARGSGREPTQERESKGAEKPRKESDKAPRASDVEARGSSREQSRESERSRKEAERSNAAEGGKRAARDQSATKDSESRGRKAAKIELAMEVITASRGAKSEGRDKGFYTSEAPSAAEAFRGSGIASYDDLVRSWHDPWPAHAAEQAIDLLAGAPPVLSLHPVGKQSTPYILLPNGPDGGFNEAQLAVASQAFGSWPGGPQISPRLLDLIYHAAKHFNVFHVHLISGVRDDRSGSRHSHGLASDIVLPGVSNEELASYFRLQGFLGVGIYTRAGFVHVDVREKSFFWLDKSPPGRRTKVVPIRAEEARLADEAAVARGQVGYVNPPRLQKALIARAKRRREKASVSQ